LRDLLVPGRTIESDRCWRIDDRFQNDSSRSQCTSVILEGPKYRSRYPLPAVIRNDVHVLELSGLVVNETHGAASDCLLVRPCHHERTVPGRHLLWIESQNEVFDRLVVSGPDLLIQCV